MIRLGAIPPNRSFSHPPLAVPAHSVLLIEDDEASQYVYGTMLRRHGFTVHSARFGRVGLEAARADPPDVVVLDLGLPEFDGLEVLRALRADPATRDVPTLVITVHVFDDDRERAIAAGCDEFLPKPLLPSELLDAIHRTLEHRARAGAAEPPEATPDPSTGG